MTEKSQEGVERAWVAEIERRLTAYRSGEMATIPASKVLAEVRAHLQSTDADTKPMNGEP